MISAKELEQKLQTVEGFKIIFPGLLGGGKAKKSFKIYNGALQFGVYSNEILRIEKDAERSYVIMAISIIGSLMEEQKNILLERVQQIELETIRSKSITYAKLECITDIYSDNCQITNLSADMNGVYVYAAVYRKEEEIDCPLAIFAYRDNLTYVYPIPANLLM